MGADLSTRRQPRRRGNKQPRRALNLQLPADEYIVGAADDDDDGPGPSNPPRQPGKGCSRDGGGVGGGDDDEGGDYTRFYSLLGM